MTTCRTFLSHSSAALAGLTLRPPRRFPCVGSDEPRRHIALASGQIDPARRVETDPSVRELALRAIDAAKAAGAVYADVRLTRVLAQASIGGAPLILGDSETYAVGVRALFDGYWGFAASPYWTPDEVVILARNAVAQARANVRGTRRSVELGTVPVVRGSWQMPVKIDPFTVPIEERSEFLRAMVERVWQFYLDLEHHIGGYGAFGSHSLVAGFKRVERAVATSEGSYFTQTLYEAESSFIYSLLDSLTLARWITDARGPYRAGMGWEFLTEADILGQLPRFYAASEEQRHWRVKLGDVGRYDVVFDAQSMADLVAGSLGPATQLDRALGYEANASGTSYLNDPLGMLGSYQVGAPLLTLTANRSMPQGLATVKWDDEGVAPEDFTLIKDGVLVDYQTTREQAAWLKEYYQKAGRPVRSHGCAASPDALSITMQHTPNLVMAPGKDDVRFEDLIRDTKKGLAVMGGNVGMDWQGRGGAGGGQVREILNGRLGAVVANLNYMYSAGELWKNLIAIGGAASAERMGPRADKGEPSQTRAFTVSAVPAKVKDVVFIDPSRKG